MTFTTASIIVTSLLLVRTFILTTRRLPETILQNRVIRYALDEFYLKMVASSVRFTFYHRNPSFASQFLPYQVQRVPNRTRLSYQL
jgi:hypothetical protein